MNRKTVGLRIGVLLFLCVLLAGCGPMEQVRNVANATAEKTGKDTKKEETSEEEDLEAEEEEDPAVQAPVFGMEDIGDYGGFRYLQKEMLTAYMDEDKENGRVKRKTVTLYIPQWEKSWYVINGEMPGTAWADLFGVTFDFSINHYLLMEEKEAPLEEMLQKYVNCIYYEEEYAAHEEYGDLEMTDVRPAGENACAITAEYCFYDDLEEEYHVCCRTTYLRELESDILVLLDVTVDGQESTPETPELLEELEAFYEVDLGWDTEEMQEKLNHYIEESEAGFSSVVKFDFPEGWEIEYEDEEIVVYAPGGNSDGAGCGIAIGDLSALALDEMLPDGENDEELLRMIVNEGIGEEADNLTVRSCGETCIGDTAAAEFCVTDGDGTADCGLYLGRKGDDTYIILAMQYQWLEMDTFEMDTFELAEELLEKGRIVSE